MSNTFVLNVNEDQCFPNKLTELKFDTFEFNLQNGKFSSPRTPDQSLSPRSGNNFNKNEKSEVQQLFLISFPAYCCT